MIDLRILFSAFLIAASGAAQANLVYEVTYHQDIGIASFRLDLSPAAELDRRAIYTRASALNIRSQIDDIRCDDAPLSLKDDGETPLPDECKILSWTSRLDSVTDHGLRLSQQSFHHATDGWGMISGPAALLRLSETTSPPQVNIRDSKGNRLYSGLLTPADAAPFFASFGKWPLSETVNHGQEIKYLIDAPGYIGVTAPWPEHIETLAYFHSLFTAGETHPSSLSSTTVIWLGVEGEQAGISGAAGSNILLINYPRSGDRMPERIKARALYVLLHEQFHQIDPSISAPAWLGESIASYYALKALERLGSDNANLAEIRNSFIATDRPVTATFLDIERQLKAGDRSNYFTLYTQGATFWYLLDQLIADASKTNESLDTYINAILRSEEDDVSDRLSKLLPAGIKPEVQKLTNTYIGKF